MSSSGQPTAFEAADYTGVLRRRWAIIVAGMVVGLVAALAYVVVAPKTYEATAAVYVASTGADQSSSSSGGKSSGSSLVNMSTEAQLVTSGTVAAIAGHMMHSTLTPYQLSKQVTAVNPPNSSVLDISCEASTATGAATCANDFAAAYLQNRRASATSVLNGEIKTLQGKITTLQSAMKKLDTTIAGLSSKSATKLSDQSLLAGDRTQVNSLNGQVVALTGQLANVQGGHVITSATPPGKPKSPSKTLDLPVGLVVGLILGLVVAFIWDRRDKRLHGAPDVERLLGLPVVLNLSRKAFGRQVSLASPRSRTGRAFTELAHTVAGSLGEGSHIVLVAGTTPGAGTSVVAANLAAALARTRGDAVLVCGDLRDSVAPVLFGVPDDHGLAEVVAGLATVSDVVSGPAGLPGLWVIPPGSDTALAEYSPQYDTAKALTSQLRRDARFVVIEAQAGDEGADSFALAEFADAAVLVVEAERVRRDEASAAIKRLSRIRVGVLGAAVIPPITGRVAVRPFQPPARPALSPGRDAAMADDRPQLSDGPSSSGQPDRPPRTRNNGRGNPADRVPRR
jgi:capsular polysaccharide biosynthesis protein/Mrp family chromosome partitioning ATPase